MRHRAGALLSLVEVFLHFTDFCALQMTDFRRHLFNRGCDQRQRRKILRMPVALQHLRRDLRRMNAQLFTDIILNERRGVGKRTDGAGYLSGFHHRRRFLKPLQVPVHFFKPERKFQAEGCDFRMHAVSPAHHDRILVPQRFFLQTILKPMQIFPQNFIGLLIQIPISRIDDVGRGQAVMNPLSFLAQRFGNRPGKRHDVMFGFTFNFIDPVDVKRGVLPQLRHVFRRDFPQLTPGLACQQLDLQPRAKLAFLVPDRPHFRAGITV